MSQKKPILLKIRSSNLYVLVTVSMSIFTDMFAYSIIVPIMPFMIDALQKGVSPDEERDSVNTETLDGASVSKQTGLLLAFFAIGLLVGSPVLGYAADRMKHRQLPMIAGIIGLLISSFLFLFGTAYWMLLLARLLQGISDACAWTLGMCLIADTFPIETLGVEMSKIMFFHSVGLVIGAPIGALYQHVGYKSSFILCVAFAIIDLMLRVCLVERRNRPAEWFEETTTATPSVIANSEHKSDYNERKSDYNERKNDYNERKSDCNEPNEKKKQKVGVLQLLRQNRLLAGLLLAFANGCVYNVFEPTLTVRLSTEWGYDSSQIGLVFLAQVIPTFVASPLAGFLTDRYGSKLITVSTLLTCAISTGLMGVPNKSTAGGIAPLIVIFAIQGFSAFTFITPVLPEIARVVQEQNTEGGDDGQAQAYAMFNVAFGLGGLVGPLLGGYLYSEIGFFWLCIVMGCFLLVCVPYVFMFTGLKGKLIVRPEDYNADETDEAITLGTVEPSTPVDTSDEEIDESKICPPKIIKNY